MNRPETPGADNAAGHSRLMDAVYRNQRHIYDATRKYYLLGRDRLIDDLSPMGSDRVIEIGCGTGRNLILAARRYPITRFYGIDISEAMLTTARANVEKAGLSDRITMARGDATDFSPLALFGIAAFERVFISYAVSMIPDWRAALRQAFAVLAEDGRLYLVDFGQQERLPGAARRLLQAWLAKFHVAPRADLPAEFETVARAHGATSAFSPLNRGYAWYFSAHRTASSG